MNRAAGMPGAGEQNDFSNSQRLRACFCSRLCFHLLSATFLPILLFPLLLSAQDDYFNHTEVNWFTIETPHFFVHYHNGEERSARVVAKVAEDIYGPVTSLYHHEPDQKVSIILKDYDDYSNGEAFFYDNKIELWAPPLDFDLRGTHNWFRNVVTHEFTHIIQIQTSMKFGRHVPGIYLQWLGYEAERRQDVLYGYPNVIVSYPVSGFLVPSWFAEGVAQYNRPELSYDYWDSHRDMILRMYALDGNMLSWTEMSVFGKTSLGNESSYNAGFALVKYISETYGADAIPKIAKNLSSLTEMTIDGAIKRAIGKSGQELYDEWRSHIVAQYRERSEPILRNRVEGETIGSVGFGNFYPAFSPDGKRIAYTSNKTSDYFGISSIYIYDLESKKEVEVDEKVRSSVSWSPDGKTIYYSKITRNNPHWSEVGDVYAYDLDKKEEKRLTFSLRALNPSVSPDGKTIVFVVEKDATLNLGIVDSDGKNFRLLTNFKNGEQVFTPKWSPDGSAVVFGYSLRGAQDIARVNAADGNLEMLLTGTEDQRNPAYSPDGKKIYFSSDKTGIFNIYTYNTQTKEVEQVSNVLGGAFMPSVNQAGDIAFASYTSGGFKLNLLRSVAPKNFLENSYVPKPALSDSSPAQVTADTAAYWSDLRSYDDTQLPPIEPKPYKNIFTSLSIVPFLRIDEYSTTDKAIDYIKPGFYFTSSDVVDKLDIFGGAAMNDQFERDLFFIFEYRDRIPGLYQLGWSPTVSLELYNITRDAKAVPGVFGIDTLLFNPSYGLLEFDLNFKQNLFSEADVLTLGYANSRYSQDIATTVFEGNVIPGSSDLYFTGNDFSLTWEFKGITPSRDAEINPVGRKAFLRCDYELDHFNYNNEYSQTETGVSPVLSPFNFPKAELKYSEFVQMPWAKHTLSLSVHGGTIFGPQVPDFFDFYAGGMVGMKGYPFYALGGNRMAIANATYRFPLWDNIDFRLPPLYFDKLYASVQSDFGNAWNGNPAVASFKKDAGFELRLESYSFYAYPTRIFFNGTYGFDSFSITGIDGNPIQYGREWRFYFGVLFDFDVD
ncbi:MAG: biopolymer transporter Tol [Bacteroidota bacterium]